MSGHRRPVPLQLLGDFKDKPASAPKPKPQRSVTDTTAFPFYFLQASYAVSRSTASNKLLKSNRMSQTRSSPQTPLLKARATKRRDVHQ
jgi:hypothetical protein